MSQEEVRPVYCCTASEVREHIRRLLGLKYRVFCVLIKIDPDNPDKVGHHTAIRNHLRTIVSWENGDIRKIHHIDLAETTPKDLEEMLNKRVLNDVYILYSPDMDKVPFPKGIPFSGLNYGIFIFKEDWCDLFENNE